LCMSISCTAPILLSCARLTGLTPDVVALWRACARFSSGIYLVRSDACHPTQFGDHLLAC
jgi:hypothetical protein